MRWKVHSRCWVLRCSATSRSPTRWRSAMAGTGSSGVPDGAVQARLHAGGVGFGQVAVGRGGGALEGFEGAGVVVVDDGVELIGEGGEEVVAHAFGFGEVDD